MEYNHFLERLAERLGLNASVKNVFGEPIVTQGKTIIPVAKVAMGLGGGSGQLKGKADDPETIYDPENAKGREGGGGGGGMTATAKGVYEVTDKCTRFIPANATRQLLIIGSVAYLLGRWMERRRG